MIKQALLYTKGVYVGPFKTGRPRAEASGVREGVFSVLRAA